MATNNLPDGWEAALVGQPCVLCADKQAEIERLRGVIEKCESKRRCWVSDDWVVGTTVERMDDDGGLLLSKRGETRHVKVIGTVEMQAEIERLRADNATYLAERQQLRGLVQQTSEHSECCVAGLYEAIKDEIERLVKCRSLLETAVDAFESGGTVTSTGPLIRRGCVTEDWLAKAKEVLGE
jgi:hypothetical protein